MPSPYLVQRCFFIKQSGLGGVNQKMIQRQDPGHPPPSAAEACTVQCVVATEFIYKL